MIANCKNHSLRYNKILALHVIIDYGLVCSDNAESPLGTQTLSSANVPIHNNHRQRQHQHQRQRHRQRYLRHFFQLFVQMVCMHPLSISTLFIQFNHFFTLDGPQPLWMHRNLTLTFRPQLTWQRHMPPSSSPMIA